MILLNQLIFSDFIYILYQFTRNSLPENIFFYLAFTHFPFLTWQHPGEQRNKDEIIILQSFTQCFLFFSSPLLVVLVLAVPATPQPISCRVLSTIYLFFSVPPRCYLSFLSFFSHLPPSHSPPLSNAETHLTPRSCQFSFSFFSSSPRCCLLLLIPSFSFHLCSLRHSPAS